MDFYRRCAVEGLNLRVNSLGDRESKTAYSEHLRRMLMPRASTLSEESRRRLDTNPLRILDTKDPRDQEAVADIADSLQFLSLKSQAHFKRVTDLLTRAEVPFEIDPTLVRGFDYYTEKLWEVTATGLAA